MSEVAVLGTGHTGITVSDLDRSIAFYRDILGFEVSNRMTASGPMFERVTGIAGCVIDIAFVRGPGCMIELLQYREPANRLTSALRACDTGFWHLCLKVRDLDQVVTAIQAGGFKALSEVQIVSEPPLKGLKAVYARDPDGVVLELLEEPPGVSLENMAFGGR